jgi:hypothetical protein
MILSARKGADKIRLTAFPKPFRFLEKLSICQNPRGEAKLNGERVAYIKVGIMDLEPLYEKLESGVELFEESEA